MMARDEDDGSRRNERSPSDLDPGSSGGTDRDCELTSNIRFSNLVLVIILCMVV